MRNFYTKPEIEFIYSKAQGRWPEILVTLGIDKSFLRNKHMPCPICGGRDRFRFDDKGQGAFICSHCGAGKGIKLLQLYHRWNYPQALSAVDSQLGIFSVQKSTLNKSNPRQYAGPACIRSTKASSEKRRHNVATWAAGRSVIKDDPVDIYLRARGIKLDQYPDALRFHPCLPYYDNDMSFIGNFPAMLALVSDADSCGVTLHRTYLGDSAKASVPEPKKLMSPIYSGAIKGSSIKLMEPANGQLALAEGIETALSFYIATGISVWATMNAWGLENVILPSFVNNVVICVDNDESKTGQKAALSLSRRLVSQGLKVRRVMPQMVGLDINDVLLMEGSHDDQKN